MTKDMLKELERLLVKDSPTKPLSAIVHDTNGKPIARGLRVCPICLNSLFREWNYCPYCGQRIERGE